MAKSVGYAEAGVAMPRRFFNSSFADLKLFADTDDRETVEAVIEELGFRTRNPAAASFRAALQAKLAKFDRQDLGSPSPCRGWGLYR